MKKPASIICKTNRQSDQPEHMYFLFAVWIVYTVMILNFLTDRSGQTVQTQVRLLLEEQSDQGLHCLLFHLHVFDKIPSGMASLFEF